MYKLQSTSFSYGNYIEQIMLCKKENSIQIARLVILGADRRSRLRCQRWQSFTESMKLKCIGEYKLCQLSLNIGLKFVEVHGIIQCLHKPHCI